MHVFVALLILAFSGFVVSSDLENEDSSLKNACNFMGGVYRKRDQPGDQAAQGDTCEFTFHVYTVDDEQALEFCELYAPWRILEAKKLDDEKTYCHVEATFICDSGWAQMNGMCYRTPDLYHRYTRAEAEETCKNERNQKDGKIAFLNRKYIVGVWSRYYRGLEQIWVRASETWDKYLQITSGTSLVLAFTGDSYDFNVYSNSLIRVDPDLLMHVICEYQPRMTKAEINYIGRRYSSIYYPGIPVDHGLLIRSASQYPTTEGHTDICKKVFAPFYINELGDFYPTPEIRDALTRGSPKGISYSHALAKNIFDKAKMNDDQCKPLTDDYRIQRPNANDFLLKDFHKGPNVKCDNMRSTALTHLPDANLYSMSDSRMAPVWCKLGRAKKFEMVVPDGYTIYKRETGRVFAHKIYSEKMTFHSAEQRCVQDGAHLSGFDSVEEAKFLAKIVAETCGSGARFWLGAQRIGACKSYMSFSTTPEDPCFRAKIFEWKNNVANNWIADELWGVDSTHANPNNFQKSQNSLVGYALGQSSWLTGMFDDQHGHSSYSFVCGKYVEMNEVYGTYNRPQ